MSRQPVPGRPLAEGRGQMYAIWEKSRRIRDRARWGTRTHKAEVLRPLPLGIVIKIHTEKNKKKILDFQAALVSRMWP